MNRRSLATPPPPGSDRSCLSKTSIACEVELCDNQWNYMKTRRRPPKCPISRKVHRCLDTSVASDGRLGHPDRRLAAKTSNLLVQTAWVRYSERASMAKVAPCGLAQDVYRDLREATIAEWRSLPGFIETAALARVRGWQFEDDKEVVLILNDDAQFRRLRAGSQQARRCKGAMAYDVRADNGQC